jgi:murein DD-endopeptidase MepM/ murein hydrolase activator NlpD
VRLAPERPRPGDVVLVRVAGGPPGLEGEWNGQPLRFFPVPGGLAALAGVDLDTRPGPLAWRLARPMADGGRLVVGQGTVTVQPRHFETQHLTLPPAQVDLDPATLARVRAEQAELAAVLAASGVERLWTGPFRTPVDGGQPSGGFGLRRVINKQPRSPHTGYDWAAPRGTPVFAANAGRVALAGEHFFAGRLVVLDHGLGLFTLYFHLDETRVTAGERVQGGQPIGTVGATGRVTGPHLHLGVSLGGARVDPMALLALVPPDGG